MNAFFRHTDHAVQEAAEEFRQAQDKDELWSQVNRHLSVFGITGLLYGSEAMPHPDKGSHDLLLSTIDPVYLKAKLSSGLFYCDEFVRAARRQTEPLLWSDTSLVVNLTPQSKRSLDLDWDFKVTTGVTIPMRFTNGLGASSIGCHAAGMGWEEFERLWSAHGDTIRAIVGAFDARLRADHTATLFPLSERERECLLWLSVGLRPQQIAARLGTHVKTVEKQIGWARRKLGAASVPQAVTIALAFGLIAP